MFHEEKLWRYRENLCPGPVRTDQDVKRFGGWKNNKKI